MNENRNWTGDSVSFFFVSSLHSFPLRAFKIFGSCLVVIFPVLFSAVAFVVLLIVVILSVNFPLFIPILRLFMREWSSHSENLSIIADFKEEIVVPSRNLSLLKHG